LYDIKNILAMQLDNNSNKIKVFIIISWKLLKYLFY